MLLADKMLVQLRGSRSRKIKVRIAICLTFGMVLALRVRAGVAAAAVSASAAQIQGANLRVEFDHDLRSRVIARVYGKETTLRCVLVL